MNSIKIAIITFSLSIWGCQKKRDVETIAPPTKENPTPHKPTQPEFALISQASVRAFEANYVIDQIVGMIYSAKKNEFNFEDYADIWINSIEKELRGNQDSKRNLINLRLKNTFESLRNSRCNYSIDKTDIKIDGHLCPFEIQTKFEQNKPICESENGTEVCRKGERYKVAYKLKKLYLQYNLDVLDGEFEITWVDFVEEITDSNLMKKYRNHKIVKRMGLVKDMTEQIHKVSTEYKSNLLRNDNTEPSKSEPPIPDSSSTRIIYEFGGKQKIIELFQEKNAQNSLEKKVKINGADSDYEKYLNNLHSLEPGMGSSNAPENWRYVPDVKK